MSRSLLPCQNSENDYRYINQAISVLSGVSLMDIGEDYKTFGISFSPDEQYRVTVVYVEDKINDVVVCKS